MRQRDSLSSLGEVRTYKTRVKMTEAVEAISALNRHVLKLLVRLREMLDEIMDIMKVEMDEELQARIEEGLEDMREGRMRRLEEFLRELEEEEKHQRR